VNSEQVGLSPLSGKEPYLVTSVHTQNGFSMPPREVEEPHGFFPANQQRSGHVTDSGVMASDQSAVTQGFLNFSMLPEVVKWAYGRLQTSTLQS